MLKPICVPCERFYRPDKIGVYFTEGMPRENKALAGKRQPEAWRGYKLWSGDRWKCPDCGSVIIVGVGQIPLSEQHMSDFDAARANLRADLMIKDC